MRPVRYCVSAVLALLLWASCASAAIGFDTAADGGNNGGATSSLTFSYTCTGSLRGLDVEVVGDVTGGADDISSVTYNGAAMTLVGKVTDAGLDRYSYLYHLENPASGANNVVVTAGSAHYLLAGAVSYTGVKATGQPDASTTNVSAASATTLTTSVTTIADNAWTVLSFEVYRGGTPPTAGTGSTRRVVDAAFGLWALFDSNAAITPAGSYSMATTATAGGSKIGHVMASFAPDTGGGGATSHPCSSLRLLGVGCVQ